MKRLSFIILLASLWTTTQASSSYKITTENSLAYQELLKLKLNSGREILTKYGDFEKNGIDIYFANYADAIELILSEDRELYEEWEDREDERLKVIKDMDKESPYFLFIQAEIKMQWALVKLKFGKVNSAALSGIKAYNLLQRNAEKYPDFLPNKKTLGACKVLIGSLPKKDKRWARLFGFKGDLSEGLADIEEVAQSNGLFALEASILLGFVKSYVLSEHFEAYQHFEVLKKQEPDNLMIHLASALAAKKNHQAALVTNILDQIPSERSYYTFYFIDYLKGEAHLQLGNYYQAIRYNKSFIRDFKGENYKKDAYFKIYLSYWFLNDSRANQYFSLAQENGNDFVIPDKYASKFMNDPIPHHQGLTQIRFYSDGGELPTAQSMLDQLKPEHFRHDRNLLEFYYRKARLLHQQKKYYLAISWYKKAIANTEKNSPYYFGANACLQLGYIYKNHLKDKVSAQFYFKEALTYNKHEYKNSIDNKAKGGLNMLKQKNSFSSRNSH